MLIYENTHYQVHALPTEGTEKQFQVVGKAFGLVEFKVNSLTNALFQADANSKALDKFFSEATGKFNPELMGEGEQTEEEVEATEE